MGRDIGASLNEHQMALREYILAFMGGDGKGQAIDSISQFPYTTAQSVFPSHTCQPNFLEL